MTPFKTILIDALSERRLADQLAVGVSIARQFDAHLVGLAILPVEAAALGAGRRSHGAASTAFKWTTFRKEVERMKGAFHASVVGEKFSSEWIFEDRLANGDAMRINKSQMADLIVASCGAVNRHGPRALLATEQLLMGSGRSVLLLPRVRTSTPLAHRVLVAWNGTREATKAAFDAIPFLQLARHVKIMLIDESAGTTGGRFERLGRLCQALQRHDVQPETEIIALPVTDAGSALMSAVKAENADLLVMGFRAYPHGYELRLGDASRRVLSEPPVPVLMAC